MVLGRSNNNYGTTINPKFDMCQDKKKKKKKKEKDL
jgi:hypothetical protein